MSTTDHDHTEQPESAEGMTQGENPGAQGDIGAGHGESEHESPDPSLDTPGRNNPGPDDPTVTEDEPTLDGDEQPRREQPLDDSAI